MYVYFSCYHCIVPGVHHPKGHGSSHHSDGYSTPHIISRKEIKSISKRLLGLTIRKPLGVHRDMKWRHMRSNMFPLCRTSVIHVRMIDGPMAAIIMLVLTVTTGARCNMTRCWHRYYTTFLVYFLLPLG